MSNVLLILQNAAEFAHALAYDELLGGVVCLRALDLDGYKIEVGCWEDMDTAALVAWFSTHYEVEISSTRMHEAIGTVAKKNGFHPVRDYLSAVKGKADPTACYTDLLAEAMKLPKTEYARAVLRKTLIAAVARAYQPGCKHDAMLILEGPQGCGKSRGFRALVSDERWYKSDLLHVGGQNAVEAKKQLGGKWMIEIAELDAMRKSEVDAWKAFVSEQVDNYRGSYGRITSDHPRQCIFVGTVNNPLYLRDETGNRRFWPVKTSATRKDKIDVAWIEKHRDQIWAEAVLAYEAGETWHLDDALEDIAEEETAQRYDSDPWEPAILAYLDKDGKDKNGDFVKKFATTGEIMIDVLGIPLSDQDKRAKDRVSAILRRAGWQPEQRRIKDKNGNNRVYAYRRPAQIPAIPIEPAHQHIQDKITDEQFNDYPETSHAKVQVSPIRAPESLGEEPATPRAPEQPQAAEEKPAPAPQQAATGKVTEARATAARATEVRANWKGNVLQSNLAQSKRAGDHVPGAELSDDTLAARTRLAHSIDRIQQMLRSRHLASEFHRVLAAPMPHAGRNLFS